jgi:hypothetical protein
MITAGRWAPALTLSIVAAAAGAHALGFFHCSIDDAYISLAYARNLVDGLGPVYNPGERVEGFSNPPWTFLMAAGLALGLPSLTGAKLAGLASHMATILGAGLFARRLVQPTSLAAQLAPVVGAAFLAVSLPANWWAMSGLETTSYGALTLLAYWRLSIELEAPGRRPVSAAIGALAALSRPEAPLVLLPLVLMRLWKMRQDRNWRDGGMWMGIFAVPTVGWLLFRLGYYGRLFPNTFYKKNTSASWEALWTYVKPWLLVEWPFVVVGLAGLVWLAIQRRSQAWPVVGAFFAMVAFLVHFGRDWMPNVRFVVPFLPILAMGAGAGLALLADRLRPELRWLPLAIGMGLLGFQTGTERDLERASITDGELVLTERTEEMYLPRSLHQPWAGLDVVPVWLLERAPAGSTVAFTDIGMLGWATDFRIIDLAGLTDAVWSGSTGLDDPGMAAVLGERAPDWIVLKTGPMSRFRAIAESPWLVEHYELMAGPNGTLAARRRDSAWATPEQVAAHYQLAIAREPRNLRLNWRAMAWLHAIGDDDAVQRGCQHIVETFPGESKHHTGCEKLLKRKVRKVPPVPTKPLPAGLARHIPGYQGATASSTGESDPVPHPAPG